MVLREYFDAFFVVLLFLLSISLESDCNIYDCSALPIQVLCGMAHVLAISDLGDLYSWGANSYGQIGVGTTLNTSIPTVIDSINERF